MKPVKARLGERIETQLSILLTLLGTMWAAALINGLFFQGQMVNWGIHPRGSLLGIVFYPFLHGGLAHLVSNTVPFFILGWLVMLRRFSDFFPVTAIVWLCSGLGIWLFGAPNSVHVGASGLVFGYFGFLLMRAWVERSLGAIALALVTFLLYGGMLWGLLPIRYGVSWQGHLFGFLGGWLAARLLAEDSSNHPPSLPDR